MAGGSSGRVWGTWLLLLWSLSVMLGGGARRVGKSKGGVLATGQGNTVFLCMLPWVLVQQVSYTLAGEGAYFPQNGVGAGHAWHGASG